MTTATDTSDTGATPVASAAPAATPAPDTPAATPAVHADVAAAIAAGIAASGVVLDAAATAQVYAACADMDAATAKQSAAAYAAFLAPVVVGDVDLTSLLESELQTAKGSVATADALARKKTVGLYFSAHWCPPCRKFTPMLAQVYDDIKEQDGLEDELEIVYVSYDRTPEEFDEYFADMPWLALPYAKRELKKEVGKTFGVRGVPTLAFVDDKGQLITRDGREVVEEHAADTTALLQALQALRK